MMRIKNLLPTVADLRQEMMIIPSMLCSVR